MKNILIFVILGVACLTSYLSTQAVNTTAATHEAQCLANGVVGAMKHFKMLADEAVKLAVFHARRVAQLEKYIQEAGLHLPAGSSYLPSEQPAPSDEKRNLNEVI